MKKIFFTLVIGVLCLTVVGCGSTSRKAEKLMDKALDQADKMMDQAENEMEKIENDLNANKTYQVLVLGPIEGYAVLYKGEVYVNVYDSTPNIDNVYGEGKFQILVNTRNNYKEYNFDGLEVKGGNINGKWQKLNISNVKKLYNNDYGQAISNINPKYGILMLCDDNTVSYISILDLINGNSNPQKLEVTNVKDIVAENHMGYTTYVVDANNNKTNVNDLIK